MEPYKGIKLNIELTEDAKSSYQGAFAQAKSGCIKQLTALIKRLGDHGSLRSPDQMNTEGDKFYAIKARCGLRAYGWFHRKQRGVFVISHVIMKKKQKLDQKDKDRMVKNRTDYEGEANG